MTPPFRWKSLNGWWPQRGRARARQLLLVPGARHHHLWAQQPAALDAAVDAVVQTVRPLS